MADLTYSTKQALREELRAWERGKVTAAWYYPGDVATTDPDTGTRIEPHTIYAGELSPNRPSWNDPAINMDAWNNSKKAIREGRAEEAHLYQPLIGDWQERFKEYRDAMKYGLTPSQIRTAGTVTTDDFSAITVLNVMAELLGRNYLANTLSDAITTVNTPSLTLQIDTYSKFTAWQDVEEGAEVATKKGQITRQEMKLLKDVGHVAFTDEVLMKGYQHNVYQAHIENAVADLRRIKSRKIATELQNNTNVGGADWGAISGSFSTTNPYDNVGTLADTIWSNGGNPNSIATADRPYRDFSSNTYVKGTTAPVPNQQYGARMINGVPGLPSFNWAIDQELPNTLAIVYDKAAVILAQGPVRTAQYRTEQSGIDGYIVRDWNGVKTVQSGFIRVLTGISA